MPTPDRRVRRVRLGAPAAGLVRRGAVLLEDALRTASLGGDGGRLLLVRRVDVGRIRARGAPSSVALALESRVRQAGAYAVHGGDPAAASSTAVWFHDAVEAHAALALRLAAGHAAAEWFWPLAVPRWQRGMARDEALRAVLGSVADLAPGPVAAVAVVAALMEEGAAGPLLDALRWQDGPALLRACGWSAPSTPVRLLRAGVFVIGGDGDAMDDGRPAGVAEVEPRWMAEIAARAWRWGEDDARTLWLAAAALVTAAPSSALDPRLGDRAARLVAAVFDAEAGRPVRPAPSASQSPQLRSSGDDSASAAPAHEPGSHAADRSTERGRSPADATASGQRDPSPISADRSLDESDADRARAEAAASDRPEAMHHASAQTDHPARSDAATAQGAGDADTTASKLSRDAGRGADSRADEVASAGSTVAAARSAETRDSAAVATGGDRGYSIAPHRPQDVRDEASRDAASTSALTNPDRPLAESAGDSSQANRTTSSEGLADNPVAAASAGAGVSAADRETARELAEPRQIRPRFPDVPLATAGGGLVFLVPALNRLGMAGMLRDTGWAANAAFPARLLRHLALRTGIPANDPILTAFGVDGHFPRVAGEAWCAPAAWARGIASEGPCIMRHLADGGHVLVDASGRLPLAAWRGDDVPAAAEAWLEDAVSSPERGSLSHSRTLALSHLLLDSWTIAARRWCRRAARMGLATLVRRPARVLYTRTHLDLLLDHHDADVRVRRAGLDVDPGWVPWLGRVVQIHYLYGERPRAQ
ncbi:MAG TPA: hypothetical protein VFS20_08750 [Longimicrobium sp.]|nr:hypothetical protein [Longimicrobium sp.]